MNTLYSASFMKRVCFYTLLAIIPLITAAQKKYPADVVMVLQKAAGNRPELEKVIQHFMVSKDSLKLKAAYFLIANMDIHQSVSYFWADSSGNKVPYNELDYADFNASVTGFEAIKARTPKIHPQPIAYKDVNTIKADFLIDNIERAFEAWRTPRSKNISFADFCEFLLPYRISIEPLQDWRARYRQYFQKQTDSIRGKPTVHAIDYLIKDCRQWFSNTFYTEQRKEPLPRLGALQLLFRKKGPCEDIADLQVFTLRSQGIPASVDHVPYWATSSDSHFFNIAIGEDGKVIPFDALKANSIGQSTFAREPGKVIRLTYSRQKNTLAAVELPENIPKGFLRAQNYKDVTAEYWETQNVQAALFPASTRKKAIYACVFNKLSWKPVWWGLPRGNAVTFNNMGKGVVYLPMDYIQGKLQPAGYPVVAGYHHTMTLRPDVLHAHTIRLPEQERYLIYRPGKKYTLYYWDNRWISLGKQITKTDTKELVFEKVPKNALLLLVPEYSVQKERPFIITDDGQRVWW